MQDWKLPEEIIGAGKRYGGRMKGAKNRIKPEQMNEYDCENVKRYKRDREKCRNENLSRAFTALKCILGYEHHNISRVDILTQARCRIEELHCILTRVGEGEDKDQPISVEMLTSEEFWDSLFNEDENMM